MPASSNKVIIPEAVIFQTVKAALITLREDYLANAADTTKSFLYRCIGTSNSIQRYDMLEQAISVFITPKNPNEPRFVDVSMGFDSDRIGKKMPTIHVIMQNESPKNDSMGIGSGNIEPEFSEVEDEYSYIDSKVRRFSQQVNLLISGDNSNEKILIYHVLKSMLIQYIPYFEVLGFDNLAINGGEVSLNTQVAGNIYLRSLSLNFEYNLISPNIDSEDFGTKIYTTIEAIQDGSRTEIFTNVPED